MNSCSLPLLGSRRISFRSLISAGVSFKTSPILIPPTSHEFKDQAVSEFLGSKDNLINGLFFYNILVSKRFCSEELSQHGRVTWILERLIDVVFDEIEEC